MPLVSVLMPVHNAARYVGEAVESILEQSFRDVEFIIVDDGSTDHSLEILRRYEQKDSRIVLISRENRGLVATLNEMLAVAKGDLCARMDADDVSLPDRFAYQIQFLASNPQVGVVGGQVELIDSKGASLRMFPSPTTHEAIDAKHMLGHGAVITHPTAMFRKALLQEAGGYRMSFWPAEDLDLFLRLAERTRLASVGELVLKYRQHLHSTSYMQRTLQVAAAKQAVAEACVRRGVLAPALCNGTAANQGCADPRQTWAWWALGAGNVATARKYAAHVMARRPFSLQSWRLAACALRGR